MHKTTKNSSNKIISVLLNLPKTLNLSANLIPVFALFLHRTYREEVIVIKLDKGFVTSTLETDITFIEFKNNIKLVNSVQFSTSFFIGTKVNGDFGFTICENNKICLHYTESSKYLYSKKMDSTIIQRWESHITNIYYEAKRNQNFMVKSFCYIDDTEKKLILNEWNKTFVNFNSAKTLHELFEQQVQKKPNDVAVKFKNKELSYYDLNAKANQLATLLRNYGVGRDALVGVCIERSIELVIALIGILKSGGAYVPLDSTYPDERLLYTLSDSKAKILLTNTAMSKRFAESSVEKIFLDKENSLANYSTKNLNIINHTTDLCYVIYTSGSTGKPKGVGNIHQGVVNRILWMQKEYQLQSDDKIIQKTPFGFDVSVWEFFWPLIVGVPLIMAEPGVHKDPEALANLIHKEQVTTIHFVPSMLNLFLESDVHNKCSSLKRVFVSGEALPYELQKKFFNFLDIELYNLYGPTEASIDVTYWHCSNEYDNAVVPIGYPIANTQIYILDEFLHPVPVGVLGELFIGGIGVARGYIHQEELTTKRFIPNPFIEGERLYCTGDLCRFLSGGIIEYSGRIDNQVKIRGLRIELGEIEVNIRKNPAVIDVIVTTNKDHSSQIYLTAYIITNKDHVLLEKDLITSLTAILPEYMVPNAFVFIDKFPISENGKLDIKQLPKPELKNKLTSSNYIAPLDQNESILLKIWQEIFGFNEISTNDSFFKIGGHSLQAIELVIKIKKVLGKHISLLEIFHYPTIQKQAELISNRDNISHTTTDLICNRKESFKAFPLTDIQQAYLIGRTDNFELGGIRSHIYVENEFDYIDIIRLENAVNILISRHQMLRTIILDDGTQKTLKKSKYYSIKVSEQNVQDVRNEIIQQFAVGNKDTFFEIRVTKTKFNKMIVHFYIDLLIADGTGLEIIFNELSCLYESPHQIGSAPSISYKDFVLFLNKHNSNIDLAKSYWLNRLLPDAPELPTVLGSISKKVPFVRRKGMLSSVEWTNLQNRALSIGVTPATFLIMIYGIVIKNWSKSAHFTLNLMFFNRPSVHNEIHKVVGNFSTTLLLEMDLRGESSLEEKAKKIQKQLLEDLENSEFNGIKVLNERNRKFGGSATATMPVVFACGLNIKDQDKTNASNIFKWYGKNVLYNQLETPQVWFDHQVFEDDDKSLCFFWDTRDNYFPVGMIDEMFDTYQYLLKEIADNKPLPFSLVPELDRKVIAEINSTDKQISYSEYLHFEIFQQAVKNPNKIAIKTNSIDITYQQMIQTALILKERLDFYNILPNDFIAIIMDKGWEQIVASLAIHASGGAYIPIDIALPQERIKTILSNSNCKVIIAQKPLTFSINIPILLLKEIIKNEKIIKVPFPVQKINDLAYVIFTSGSTGIPKGVMIEHKAAVNTIEAINTRYNINSDDCAFGISSLSFDLSVYDIFGLLRVGGTIYIPDIEEIKNPNLWARILKQNKITLWNSVPALTQIFVENLELENNLDTELRLILMSGDWIPLKLPENIKKIFGKKIQVVSLGGATEASIWSNCYEIEKVQPLWSSIPYGKPLDNQYMYILDQDLKERPFYAIGMIYIGGNGLSRGYLGDSKKTNESFFFHKELQKRLYRTGDLGRLSPDGNIEILGREDLQVKVQGYRIELEEIEFALHTIPKIKQAVVQVIGNKEEAKKIVAFFVASDFVDIEEIKLSLQEKLPFYMVPNRFLKVDSLPLTPNGKVDLKKLINHLNHLQDNQLTYDPPRSNEEKAMVKIWKNLLKVQKISRDDNFFAIGGTSFLAFQMIYQIKKELGLEISIADLLQSSSIAALTQKNKEKEDTSFILLQKTGDKPPLFLVHPSGGGAMCYKDFVQTFSEICPVYAFQSLGYMEERTMLHSIEEMARHYIKILLKYCNTNNSIWLGGWSFGGIVSFEMGKQLKSQGYKINPLILIDSPCPNIFMKKQKEDVLRKWFIQDYGDNYTKLNNEVAESLFKVFSNNINALVSYSSTLSTPAEIDIFQIKAKNIYIDQLRIHPSQNEDDWGWKNFTTGKILSILLDTDHSSILQDTNLVDKVKHFLLKKKNSFSS